MRGRRLAVGGGCGTGVGLLGLGAWFVSGFS